MKFDEELSLKDSIQYRTEVFHYSSIPDGYTLYKKYYRSKDNRLIRIDSFDENKKPLATTWFDKETGKLSKHVEYD
jgi:hypothetical protein